ncbi:phage virion morphogenesis protein [Janthinobacterium sp. PSPC1-1]
MDKISKKGAKHTYPARPLLGLNEADRTLIRESLMYHLTKI